MKNRRNFLRDITLAIAATLLPKILQPTLCEIVEEEMITIPIGINLVIYGSDGVLKESKKLATVFNLTVPKSQEDFTKKVLESYQLETR